MNLVDTNTHVGDDHFLLYDTNEILFAWWEKVYQEAFVLNGSNSRYYWNKRIVYWEDQEHHRFHPYLPKDMQRKLGNPVLVSIYTLTVTSWEDYEFN